MRLGLRQSVLALAMLLALAPALGQGGKPAPEDPEVKLGRESAAENDKNVKLITDAALLERVNRIGQEIARVANSEKVPATWGSSEVKQFSYVFKIVDDKDVNAYSLPGGFIYVNKGLLDYVRSDDELAGVLAHEVAHASHHHMMKLLKEQSKLQYLPIVLALGAILGKASYSDASALGLAGNLYMIARLNSYGVEAEKDADQAGVRYLLKTKYNPVGMLTFMERLARDEMLKPERVLGIFQTHPPSPERAKALLAQLDSLKVPVNRRLVDPTLNAVVTTVNLSGTELAQVSVNKTILARFAADDGLTAEARAKEYADAVDLLIDEGLQIHEVRVSHDRTGVVARGRQVLTISRADASAQKSSEEQLASAAAAALRNLLWKLQFERTTAR